MSDGNAAGQHPYRTGGKYILFEARFYAFLCTLKPTVQQVALAWLYKWGARTMDGRKPEPISFSPEDVAHLGVSRSSFHRAMRTLEGRVLRKESTGGGRAKSHYEPCDAWKHDPCQIDTAAVSKRHGYLSQFDTGLDPHNVLMSEVVSVMSSPLPSSSGLPEQMGVCEPPHRRSAEELFTPTAPPESDGGTEVVDRILAYAEPYTDPEKSLEREVLFSIVARLGASYLWNEARTTYLKQRQQGIPANKFLGELYRRIPDEKEVPFGSP